MNGADCSSRRRLGAVQHQHPGHRAEREGRRAARPRPVRRRRALPARRGRDRAAPVGGKAQPRRRAHVPAQGRREHALPARRHCAPVDVEPGRLDLAAARRGHDRRDPWHAGEPAADPLPGSFEDAVESVGLYKQLEDAASQRLRDRSAQDAEFLKQNFAASRQPVRAGASWRSSSLRSTPRSSARTRTTRSPIHQKSYNTVWQIVDHPAEGAVGLAPRRGRCLRRSPDQGSPGLPGLRQARVLQPLPTAEPGRQPAGRRCRGRGHQGHARLHLALLPVRHGGAGQHRQPDHHDRWSVIIDGSIDGYYMEAVSTLGYWAQAAKWEQCGDPGADLDHHRRGAGHSALGGVPAVREGRQALLEVRRRHGTRRTVRPRHRSQLRQGLGRGQRQHRGLVGAFGQLDWSPRSGKIDRLRGPRARARRSLARASAARSRTVCT